MTSVDSCVDCISTSGCSSLRVYDGVFYDNQNYGGLMSVYICPPCISNCIACNDDVSCNQCASGYVFNYNSSILSYIFQVPPLAFCVPPFLSVFPVAMDLCAIRVNPVTPRTQSHVRHKLNIANRACMPCGLPNCATCTHISGVLTCLSCVSGSVLDTSVSNFIT